MAILALATTLILPTSAHAHKGHSAPVSHAESSSTSTTTTSTTVPPPLVAPEIMAKWSKVAWCESHQRWYQVHPGVHAFSGGIGMRNDVWWEYGGRQFAEYSGQATPEQQVFIARRVQASAGIPEYVPDQTGCNGSW